MDELKAVVQNGVKFLDQIQPNWRSLVKIKPNYSILDLRQDVFGIRHIGWLRAEYGEGKLIGCGFMVPVYNYTDDELMSMIELLSNAWVKEITNG